MAHRDAPVSIQERSANGKLSPVLMVPQPTGRPRPVPQGPFVSSTYVSISATCPDTCEYKDNGCYAQAGHGYNGMGVLDEIAEEHGWSAFMTSHAEAHDIDCTFPRGVPQDGARGGRDLRLHVGGEVSCTRGARELAKAAKRWRARGGGAVWTFTKRWRQVPRSAWGSVSVLASIIKVEDIERARKRGYVPAITMTHYPSPKPFRIPSTGDLVIPCLYETQGKTCVECRMCLDDEKLRRHKIVIGFELHGRDAKRARKRLRVIQGDAFDAVPLVLTP